jgi:hypothetical protein
VGILSDELSAVVRPSDSSIPEPTSNEDPAMLEDAKAYAKDYGVSEQEALRRLRLQTKIGELERELMAKKQDTFAEPCIRDRLEYKMIAQFTKSGKRTIKPYVAGDHMSSAAYMSVTNLDNSGPYDFNLRVRRVR